MGWPREPKSPAGRNASFFATLESRFMASGPAWSVLLAFVASNAILFWYGYLLERRVHSDFKKWTTVIARGTGYMLNLDVGILLILGSRVLMGHLRSSPLNLLIPFDHAMPKAHIIVGYVSFAAAVTHGTFHFVPGVVAKSWGGSFLGWTYCVSTGFVLLSVFAVLVVFARKTVRVKKFELFYYVHLVTAAAFFAILFGHGVLFAKLYTWKWIIGPVAVYLIDRGYRMATERRGYFDVSEEGIAVVTGDILRVRVRRDFKFRAGQWAELCIPALSPYQYHPFTIASSPRADFVTFFIKSRGPESWTGLLQEMVRAGQKGDGVSVIEYRMRGPYGAPAQHAGQYEKVVLVSAGVGGTPFLSQIINFVAHVEGRNIEANLAHSAKDLNGSPSHNEQLWLSNSGNSLPDGSLERIGSGSGLPLIGSATAEEPRLAHVPSVSSLSEAQLSTFAEDDGARESLSEAVLGVLSSATASFTVLYISMLRFFLFLIATIYIILSYPESMGMGETLIDYVGYANLPHAFKIVDLLLGSIVFCVTFVTIEMDLWLRLEEVPLLHRIADILIVIPTLAFPPTVHILGLLFGRDFMRKFPPVSIYALWILTLLVVVYRHIRSGRPHTVLANSSRAKYHATRSLDFIYTTPTSENDTWLIQELGSLVHSPHFRLHRFLTREKPDEENPTKHSVGRFEANYGRPDWDDVMEKLVSNCESGSSIGLFFCGPEAMEVELRRAAFGAMERSRKRSRRSVPALHGERIRMVVRAENF